MQANTLRNLFFSALILPLGLSAQDGVLISETSSSGPNPHAILEVESTDKGVLVPRMTSSERIGIIPNPSLPAAVLAEGLMVYDTDEEAFFFFDGAMWVRIATGDGGYWSKTGGDVHYTGDNVGVGTNAPLAKLAVHGPTGQPSGQNLLLVQDESRPQTAVARLRTSGLDGEFSVWGSHGTGTFGVGRISVLRGSYGFSMQTDVNGNDPGFTSVSTNPANLRLGTGFASFTPDGSRDLGTTTDHWENVYMNRGRVKDGITFAQSGGAPEILNDQAKELVFKTTLTTSLTQSAFKFETANSLTTGYYISAGSASEPRLFRVGPDGRTSINIPGTAISPAMLEIRGETSSDQLLKIRDMAGLVMLNMDPNGRVKMMSDQPANAALDLSETASEGGVIMPLVDGVNVTTTFGSPWQGMIIYVVAGGGGFSPKTFYGYTGELTIDEPLAVSGWEPLN